MEWQRYIDSYCERLAPGFWDEPLNAVSNAAFIIAGVAALLQARSEPETRGDIPLQILGVIVIIVGTGSFLFHTFAEYWAMLADVIPISVFIFSYLGFALRRYFGLGWAPTLGIVTAFMAVSFGLDSVVPASVLHGSVGYLPALAALFVISFALNRRGHPVTGYIFAGACLFAVSLALRTIDLPLCEAWPLGTHFVWHLLNATLLYTLLRAATLHGRRA